MYALVLISALMNLNPGNAPPGAMGGTSMLEVGKFEKIEECREAADKAAIVKQNPAVPFHLAYVCVKAK